MNKIKVSLRNFLNNDNADLNIILSAIVMAIALAISIVIVWNVIAAIDTTTIDAAIDSMGGEMNDSTPALNATDNINTNLETFYTVAPIALIVVAAVGILGYVLLLRRE